MGRTDQAHLAWTRAGALRAYENDCVWLKAPRTGREAAYIAVWKYLRTVGVQERELIMARLRKVFATSPQDPEPGGSMKPEEVRVLAGDGLISIGTHTVTHPALAEADLSFVRPEIFASEKECESLMAKRYEPLPTPSALSMLKSGL